MGFAEKISFFPCFNHMKCVHVRGIRIKESKKDPQKRRTNKLILCFEEQDFSLEDWRLLIHRV
jgi:hypothetical protein